LDSVTHIVCGVCIGQAIMGKKADKRVLFIGALAQSLPDIDALSSIWLKTPADLLAHRGITHSILFCLLAALVFAYTSAGIFKNQAISLNRWFWLWVIELFTHIFLDACTAYGTGWWEPFSHTRVSFNLLYVADPLFSVFTFLGCVYLFISSNSPKARQSVAWVALASTMLYIGCSIANKAIVDKKASWAFALQHKNVQRYFTTPTPLNNLLWFAVGQTDSGFYTGYFSVFDTHIEKMRYVERQQQLIPQLDKNMALLQQFSEDYYTLEHWHDTLVFNDLRFGDMAGWYFADPHFVFHYYMNLPDANDAIVQRGRFAHWDKPVWSAFIQRIKGN